MLRMIGRLIWVAVGALGVKAYEEATRNGGTKTPHRVSPARATRKRKS